jgi:hypothetical protein
MREVSFGQDGSYSATKRSSPAQCRACQQLRQPRAAHLVDDLQEPGRRSFHPPVKKPDDAAAARQGRRSRGGSQGPLRRFDFSAGLEAWMRRCSPATPMSMRRRPGRCARPIRSAWPRCSARWRGRSSGLRKVVEPVVPARRQAARLSTEGRAGAAADRAADADLPAAGARARQRRPDADRQPLPPQLPRPGRARGRGARRAPGRAACPASSTSRPASASGATWSPPPSATDVWASIGVHPHEADAHPDLGAAALVEARAPRVVAIGECGLDYYYDKSDRDSAEGALPAHIEARARAGLPLIIHTRDAEEDTAEILSERAAGRAG